MAIKSYMEFCLIILDGAVGCISCLGRPLDECHVACTACYREQLRLVSNICFRQS